MVDKNVETLALHLAAASALNPWLENLLVSASMNGLRHHQQNPL
jgi:hypothetical protein